MLGQGDGHEETGHGDSGDGPERGFSVYLPSSGEQDRQICQQSVEQPRGGQSCQRFSVEEVLRTEQNPQSSRQEKGSEGDAELIKDAHKQSHSQLGALHPMGAGGNQHRLQGHPVKVGGIEQEQQNCENHRSGQPQPKALAIGSPCR